MKNTTGVVQTQNPNDLEKLPEGLKRALMILVERLDTYIYHMEPSKPIDPKEGGKYQKLLWQAISDVFKLPPEFFGPVYNELLYVVHQNRKGCFSKAYANRFYDYLDINSDAMKTMPRVINMLLATAEPGTRHLTARQMDLNRIMRYFKDQSAVEKLDSFYAI